MGALYSHYWSLIAVCSGLAVVLYHLLLFLCFQSGDEVLAAVTLSYQQLPHLVPKGSELTRQVTTQKIVFYLYVVDLLVYYLLQVEQANF